MSIYAYDRVLDAKNNAKKKNYFAVNDYKSATSTSAKIKIKSSLKIQFCRCYTEPIEYVLNQSNF